MRNYEEWVKKFSKPRTTDDCYTPPAIYDAVAEYVEHYYNTLRHNFVRPFYPDGNYQSYSYPDGSIVVDNPPFSILSQIMHYYNEISQPAFLFVPTLTGLGTTIRSGWCFIGTGNKIKYENGAIVNTSFATNMESCGGRSDPELYTMLDKLKLVKKNIEMDHGDISTGTDFEWKSKHGIKFFTHGKLVTKYENGRKIYGGGIKNERTE